MSEAILFYFFIGNCLKCKFCTSKDVTLGQHQFITAFTQMRNKNMPACKILSRFFFAKKPFLCTCLILQCLTVSSLRVAMAPKWSERRRDSKKNTSEQRTFNERRTANFEINLFYYGKLCVVNHLACLETCPSRRRWRRGRRPARRR